MKAKARNDLYDDDESSINDARNSILSIKTKLNLDKNNLLYYFK